MPSRRVDRIALILAALLFASVFAFLLGFIPYPYGLIVLSLLLAARILYLRSSE